MPSLVWHLVQSTKSVCVSVSVCARHLAISDRCAKWIINCGGQSNRISHCSSLSARFLRFNSFYSAASVLFPMFSLFNRFSLQLPKADLTSYTPGGIGMLLLSSNQREKKIFGFCDKFNSWLWSWIDVLRKRRIATPKWLQPSPRILNLASPQFSSVCPRSAQFCWRDHRKITLWQSFWQRIFAKQLY